MKKTTMRLFALAMLMMFSMGAWAQIDVQITNDGKFDGGTIEVTNQKDLTDGVEVTITVTPNGGYTIKKSAITVVSTYPPSVNSNTRTPEIADNLTLYYNGSEKEDIKDLSAKRDYTFIVPSGFGAWVKEAAFQEKKRDGSKGVITGEKDDYSGVYYIGSRGYAEANTTTNFYLCPTEGWAFYVATNNVQAGDNGQPFLTTYQCRDGSYDATKAVWVVEKEPNSGCYYIKQALTGRYMVSNGVLTGAGNTRARVHLETVANAAALADLGDRALFEITYDNTNTTYPNHCDIKPHSTYGRDGDNIYLVVNTNNYNQLDGNSIKTNGPKDFKSCGGIIGLYTHPDDGNACFYFETATIDPPTITNNGDGTFTISAAEGATIYYTTDGSTPTTSTSTSDYTGTGTTSVTVNQTETMTVIKAIAKGASDFFPTIVTTYNIPACERPVISVSGGTVSITCATEGAAIFYTINGDPATASSTPYAGPFAKGDISTIRAVATRAGYLISCEAALLPPTKVSSSDEITNMGGNYILLNNFSSTASIGTSEEPFKGTIDGNMVTISGLSHPLVAYAEGATIKNVILDNVSISGGTNVGAICGEATGDTRIYNCGVLATNSTVKTDEDGYTAITSCSSTISGSNYVGSIVGLLDGSSRVINCFSYANVSGGSFVGGIVGYNKVATTASNLKTMVMNCMFYGEVSGGSIAPIYNGNIITNVGENTGVSNFNYFRLESSYIQNTDITKVYNCALGAETRFLQRFEFFRNLLNSHRELAGWWATGTYSKDEMAKWVLEPSQIRTSTPYPILKPFGYYPSVVNLDADNAEVFSNDADIKKSQRNQGRKFGTLSVTIQMDKATDNSVPFHHPGTGESEASITKSSLLLPITDKDPDHFNFNYYKVQLPYYNDVGTKNYTGNRVVTGWKIVSITSGTPGTYTENDSWGGYNFADRNCTNKDLYSKSGRVFSQGAYWDVPEGVTAITIEPYWAKAAYLADENADMVYNTDMSTSYKVPYVGGGKIYNNGNSYSIAGNNQKVYTSLSSSVSGLGITGTPTVNDYAVVLVGNYHHVVGNNGAVSGSSPYTVTSVDLDGDDEPDYSLMLRNNGRNIWHPVKWDFINISGLGMAQKSTGGTGSYNLGIVVPRGWFETTNTSLFRVTQFEYERKSSRTIAAPYILQGGVMEQWVTGQNNDGDDPMNTTYFHLGGNVWFKEFHRGTHQDNTGNTNHTPISVTGGDFDKFYLTGLYRADVTSYGDNAECYINGGRFGVVAGAAMEGIGKAEGADDTGNITWQIQNADIKEFYGGGLNADRPVTGNIRTTITGGKIDLFCGGPKFGDMSTGKTVTTTATGCEFGTFFGAGYGGSSYSRRAPRNIVNMINMPAKTGDNKTYGSWNAWVEAEYKQKPATNFPGISTRFDYQFIPNSGNADNVGRLFVEHVSFSLATTRNVTSTLTNCTITGNFYGGGSLGKVDGPVTSTLTDCNVIGNVFGAGYSASLPTLEVDSIGFRVEPYYYTDLGTYRTGVKGKTTTYRWQHGDAIGIDTNNKILYTTVDLNGLGAVTGKATLTINGNTTVGHSVYGGGEESGVGDGKEGDGTEVNVNSGTIGAEGSGGVEFGNVYGGGKGKAGERDAGYVKGNTVVNISQAEGKTTTIYHNVYGGGAYGSVGDFTYDSTSGMPTDLAKAKTGACTVTITGGTIGTTGKENGMVFGSSRGDVATPEGTPAVDPNDRMAWVYSTQVNIGTENATTGPHIKGSVYGSGENGHTFQNTELNIYSGTIGIPTGSPITDNNGTPEDTSDDKSYSGASYPYRGNVYGGGCGTDKYYSGAIPDGHSANDGKGDKYNPLAGIVKGNTTLNIKGGHVARNVYGAGAMGSVGGGTTDEAGKTTINVKGGRIGYDGNCDNDGCIFGAARGEFGKSTAASGLANVRETEVNINYTTTPTADNEGKTAQLIAGSVFGGGEAGTVKESVVVNMTGGLILKDLYGGGALADTQTSNWDASANEGAGGWTDTNKKSSLYTTTVRATGGRVGEEVFGGALGEAGTTQNPTGKPAYVWGDVLVDLNGTTTMSDGKPTTEGTTIDDDAKGCAVDRVFGCNNANGTPKGDVMVHIYATQNAAAKQIANIKASGTEGEEGYTPADNTQKVEGRYDISAVYGGGNEAAYNPVTPYKADAPTGAKTQVIIDGCDRTSINTVYGGGNAAAVPETNVYIRGTFEIFNVFGGGNGKDKKSDGSDNPGADVGTLDQGQSTYGTGNANTLLEGGLIHEAYGGSNQKGIIKGAINLTTDPKDPDVYPDCCELVVEKIVGAGKYADIDGDVNMTLSCQPSKKVDLLFAGADEANVNGNITLNITNGHFGKVFGGNNLGGAIKGKITVNVEETGCQPIKIDNLYLGSNEAAYSIYGYYESAEIQEATGKNILKPRESANDSHTPVDNPATDATHTFPYAQPELNIISCTYIGNVFGGGLGEKAVMYANPTVNINMIPGLYANDEMVGVPKVMTELGLNASENPNKLGIIENVYGGGDQANIEGNTIVNIGTAEKVYLNSEPTHLGTGNYTEITADEDPHKGMYEVAVKGAYIIGNVFGGGNGVMDHLELGQIIGNTQVTIGKASNNADLIIKCSAYGGGNIGMVTGNTVVDVNNGIIGTNQKGGYKWGNVYGGGKGMIVETEGEAELVMNSTADADAGLVKGNTNVTINGGTVLHNVYGGGAVGSVGTFTRHGTTGFPTACADGTGLTTVTINGGTIGHNREDAGMVNGSSRGWECGPNAPESELNKLAWVNNTNVVIGDATSSSEDKGPSIWGSVYGGGENGHNLQNAVVTINKGTIGNTEAGSWNWGNVYGAGCGTDTYEVDNKKRYNFMAGIVQGNTTVNVAGGHVMHNVYGGGSMGSVGTFTFDTNGKPTSCAENTGLCTVNISGGKIGPTTLAMPASYGHVFGAGRGEAHDPAVYDNLATSAYFNNTLVTINEGALVKGSVYGGSESGHVLGNTKVTVSGGQIGCGDGKDDAYTSDEWTAANPATLVPVNSWAYTENGLAYDKYAGTSGYDSKGGATTATDGHTFYGNVFGGGSGYTPYAPGQWLETAGRVEGNTEVIIEGGHILSNVYGGNECTDVLGTCTVTMTNGTVGVPYPATGFNPALGHLFGAGKGDKRIFFNTWTNVKQATVSVSGGRVFGSVYGGGEDGHIGFEGDTGDKDGDATTTISGTAHIGTNGDSGYDGNVFGGGQGSPTALTAGVVQGNVKLNIQNGQIDGSVYGGGRLASVGTHLVAVSESNYGNLQDDESHGNITVNLTGGTINQNVFGGGMGTNSKVEFANNKTQDDMGISRNVELNLNGSINNEGASVPVTGKGCIVKGFVFGCNDTNASPRGTALVHVFATQRDGSESVTNNVNTDKGKLENGEYDLSSFDVKAVYGGGNLAAYMPDIADAAATVIIEGCSTTSIGQVYGGGNAASAPATNATIYSAFEIGELFGGGNGKDAVIKDGVTKPNPGANVGYKNYSEYYQEEGSDTWKVRDLAVYDTKEERIAATDPVTGIVYGTGKASVTIYGGTVHRVFGGSNTKGNVRQTAVTLLDEAGGCDFCVDEAYGGGKSAEMDAEAQLLMACIPGLESVYGGAEAADVRGNVTLNITNGTFDRVFGGNNLSGTISGSITVNVEEIGCKPVKIGELYGGGNQAAYSVYGYDSNGKAIESGTKTLYADPQVNVMSFTSIGNIYGGGYGDGATMVGNPTVNINEAYGKWYNDEESVVGENAETPNHYPIPSHAAGKMGAINNVFGGGNAAKVIGNATVNIGTLKDVYVVKKVDVGVDVSGLYTRSGAGTTASPFVYTATAATDTAVDGTTYYEKKTVLGADIRGNVYGGGNNAEVTGNTNVVIGKSSE